MHQFQLANPASSRASVAVLRVKIQKARLDEDLWLQRDSPQVHPLIRPGRQWPPTGKSGRVLKIAERLRLFVLVFVLHGAQAPTSCGGKRCRLEEGHHKPGVGKIGRAHLPQTQSTRRSFVTSFVRLRCTKLDIRDKTWASRPGTGWPSTGQRSTSKTTSRLLRIIHRRGVCELSLPALVFGELVVLRVLGAIHGRAHEDSECQTLQTCQVTCHFQPQKLPCPKLREPVAQKHGISSPISFPPAASPDRPTDRTNVPLGRIAVPGDRRAESLGGGDARGRPAFRPSLRSCVPHVPLEGPPTRDLRQGHFRCIELKEIPGSNQNLFGKRS